MTIWIPTLIPARVRALRFINFTQASIMATGDNSSSSQTGFFSDSGELGGSHPHFTEICTALYERELLNLAHSGPSNVSILRRRLAGLPHHIRSVARFLVANSSPLAVDAHNGSWFIKQPTKCPGSTQKSEMKQQWYIENADYGLVLPLRITTVEGTHLELDSIDMVDQKRSTLHTNKHGWFHFSGDTMHPIENGSNSSSLLENETNTFVQKQLLKPTTAIMASACSGHFWRNRAKVLPRALSLREMRLSTQINWKNFSLRE